jgi:hypothetical protein
LLGAAAPPAIAAGIAALPGIKQLPADPDVLSDALDMVLHGGSSGLLAEQLL